MVNKPLITSGASESKIGQVKDLVGHTIRGSNFTDQQLQSVNENGGRFQEAFLDFFQNFVQAFADLFSGLVDYDRNRAYLWATCRFDNKKDVPQPIKEWVATRRGKHQVEIREERLGKYQTLDQIDACCSPEEKDADPIAVLEIFGYQNPDRMWKHRLVTFFTIARCERYKLTLCGSEQWGRCCSVDRVDPLYVFDPDDRVLRARKSA